tara:strand:- start:2047 stop:2244 length:198 start_codon:yes stop_codon:yes gene_type:complete
MIKVGDIVFKKSSGGLVQRIIYSRIGLVIETYQPSGSLPQFKVSFPDGLPAWWEGRYLHKIEGIE